MSPLYSQVIYHISHTPSPATKQMLVSMETLKKPLAVTLFVILIACDVSLARAEKNNQQKKNVYIVHMAKSKMPASFHHHSVWYESILKSVSDSSAEMLYTYDNAIHGFSTRLTAKEAQQLNSQTGILKVLPDKQYKLHTTHTPEFLGLDKIDAMLFPTTSTTSTRSDVIVGVIDTGVWPESKSFNDTGYGPIPSRWKGKCVTATNFTASNCNKKLIGARYYASGFEASVRAIDEATENRSPRDDEGHGTHTASTATGSPVVNASLFGYASGTARGMAKGARVAIYKVCWGITCSVSDIVAAMDQAIADNVDVLSLSLGGFPEDYINDTVAISSFSAMEHGILVSFSAGNMGTPHTVTNIAPWVTTVGAGTLDRDFPADVTLGNGQNYSGVSLYKGDPLPRDPLPFIYARNASKYKGDYAGICDQGSLVPEKVKGKIVLCDSGGIDEVEKGKTVKSAGGLGMVVANTATDGEELGADPHILPATAVGHKAGEAIKEYLFSNPNPTATIAFHGTKLGIEPSPVVASFSSRGPNSITPQVLKPDLIAPGVNILAAYSRSVSPTSYDWDKRRVDFNIISGTSMSCPHVSGLAALIKSVHPEWSPAAIRSALMTTAYTAYKMNGQTLLDSATNKTATPFDFGAGHVDPVPALNPGLVYDLTVDDYLNFLCALNYTAEQIETVAKRSYTCDSKKHYSVTDLNYPSFAVVFNNSAPAGEHGAVVVKHTRTLTNVGDVGTYKVTVKSNVPSIKISVEPEVLSFKKNGKKSYVVTFTATQPKQQSFGSLEWSDGKTVVRSPYIVQLG